MFLFLEISAKIKLIVLSPCQVISWKEELGGGETNPLSQQISEVETKLTSLQDQLASLNPAQHYIPNTGKWKFQIHQTELNRFAISFTVSSYQSKLASNGFDSLGKFENKVLESIKIFFISDIHVYPFLMGWGSLFANLSCISVPYDQQLAYSHILH
jgi:hypothetical protein